MELLVVYAKSRKHARSSHNGLSFTFDWMKKWRQFCSVGIFLSKHIFFAFLLQERMEEMRKLVVKYLKVRCSARWEELTAKTAKH